MTPAPRNAREDARGSGLGAATADADATARQELVARISRQVRSELDLDAVLRVAVTETGEALRVGRCFIRLGEWGGPSPIAAEWDAPGVEPIGAAGDRLPVTNLAAREWRTVAIGDVELAPELDDVVLGGRETLLGLGTRASLATPIVVFDSMIGVFGLHRPEPGEWTESDIVLAEAIAGEVGLAIHTARLLRENERRLERYQALLEAAKVVTSELRLETVLQRLVVEVTQLLDADAADCYVLDADAATLRCAAVHGLDPALLELELPADSGLAGEALREGRGVLADRYGERFEHPPHREYEGFTTAIAAPITWSEEKRGVLAVGSRDPARRFTSSDVDTLEAFAGLASLALQNALSFERSARQARIERAFYRITAVLAEPLSLEEALAAIAHVAAESLGGTSAAVLMPHRATLRLAGSHNLSPEVERVLGDGLPDSAAVLRRSAEARRILAAPDVLEDDRFGPDWQRLGERHFRSLLAAPLEDVRSDEIGLVVVFFAGARKFREDDLDLARHLTAAARGAIERSSLYEAERRARALAQQLARTGGLRGTELDPGAVVRDVVEQAPVLLGADASALWLLAGEELVLRAAGGDGADRAIGWRAPSTARLAGDVLHAGAPVAVPSIGDDVRLARVDPMLEAGYRAYLGVPLAGPEHAHQGVLAVYACDARDWRSEEVDALQALAANASAALANAELYQQVALEKELSEAILGSVADGIVAVDRDGNVVLWNAAAEQITGVPTGEALGKTPAQVLKRNLASGEAAASGNRLLPILRGGEEVWLSVTEAVMRDPGGGVAGRVFAFRDVSAERLVEQMKSDFVSAVSHELRAPLTSIFGFAETLLRRDILFGEDERATFLRYISAEAERLTRIVDQLLNVARLDAGDLHVQTEAVDIRPLVSEAVSRAQEVDGVNGHRFVVDLPDEPVTAEADRDKLRQILAHLVDNAIKYSPEGGTVTVAARRRRDAVEVRVVDEGVGIPQAEQELIFTKFYRRPDPAGRDEGGRVGLGLFIARGLVAAMGGRVSVDSVEGEGSSFTLALRPPSQPAGEAVVR